ncbi:efflux pump antibiotic resistance protein, putative [Talaromyces stipitatus ATCC 10500]|uniref:Efflux pump antibiotic resistance protein, putative n=1 Tax=Talaromyces stipitatus (strain ATCC 10500 / CBS 375.48 / QM 6759 / NRRL 1006) TaxID=441959 RepID=B8MTK6_TALSN|nr:efflux pump antibiotic resistance protein, putative [Talaromyces stipitatus ATCC 10500]EED12412.1 efflux pump antibiotic resistance protein, putative [Talaromyces stipitatus ATCC 10500]
MASPTSSDGQEAVVTTSTSTAIKNNTKSLRFYVIIVTLCFLSVLSALENTVVTTSLPSIATELELGNSYVWVTTVVFFNSLTVSNSAVVQPLFGQLANIFGRRWVTMGVIVLFALGSGLCGGATNAAMLIAGRAIQGMGGGGFNTLPNIIVSDLVPLRERGKYVAWFLTTYFVGIAIGPWVGGAIVDSSTWRWVFYINLPIGGASMIMVFIFLQVQYDKGMSFIEKLRRIDYGGNFLLISSSVSILFALTYGGNLYPWRSSQIIVPLVIGFTGIGIFVAFENTKWAGEPVCPPHLFRNRTSAVVMIVTFIGSALLYWVYFFMPIYFQAVRGSSPSVAGLQVLPSVIVSVPASIAAVLLLTRFGRYKPIHLAGFTAITLGLGLFILLDQTSSTAEWVIFQIINSLGNGIIMNSLPPACQAASQRTESDQAATTAVWSSVRSFGNIWGVVVPAAIFSNTFGQRAGQIADPVTRELILKQFHSGNAYADANAVFLARLDETTRNEVVAVYEDALRFIWQISLALAGFSLVLVLLEKEIVLKTDL